MSSSCSCESEHSGGRIYRSRTNAGTRLRSFAVSQFARRRRPSNTSFGQLASEDAVVSVAAMSTTVQESPPVLTPRQRQVVELIAAGCSNEEVGERLGISPRTAKAHCDVLRQKLGV